MRAPTLCLPLIVLGLSVSCLANPALAMFEKEGLMSPPLADEKRPYPTTQTGDVVDEQFGVKVADPYRWLENDVRVDADVAAWVKAQNSVTDAYLATLTGRDALASAMTGFFDYERIGIPTKAGGKYFYTRNDGLQNQSVLYVRDGVDGGGRVLLDPNIWSDDGATALDDWVPSKDGTKLIYSVQDGGSDWRTIKVLDVATAQPLADVVEWVKFSSLDWVDGGAGFIYSRFPEPEKGAAFQSLNTDQAIYYHALGTEQSEDRLLYATPDEPDLNHSAQMSDDKSFALVTSSSGTDERYRLTLLDFTQDVPTPRVIVPNMTHDWQMIGADDASIYFITNKDAPRQRIVKMPRNGNEGDITEVIAQSDAVIEAASIVGGHLIVTYMVDARNMVMMSQLDGSDGVEIALPAIGSVAGFDGTNQDSETFFAFTSFNQPMAIYRFDAATGSRTSWAAPQLTFDPDDYSVEQRFYASKDGTKVPMFIVKRKDVSGAAPTLLYGYGGFNISLTPGFSATRMAWIDAGGVYVQANIRGGGEYGKAWHDGGRLANKQNVFDDFIGAGEYLIAQGITGKGQLAVEGRSNGGLLVGAVVNQRPDLFAAAHAAVGVMDMLRFDRFTAGRYWVDDYGYPSKEADFKTLMAYSPYHNVRDVAYPAVIVSTADTDDRVVPGHSFKYIAALQAAEAGDKPHIIRIETRAGHGSGKPTDKVIQEYSDIYAFLAQYTGLALK